MNTVNTLNARNITLQYVYIIDFGLSVNTCNVTLTSIYDFVYI